MTMKMLSALLPLLLLGVISPLAVGQSIADIVSSDNQFSILSRALTTANLVGPLASSTFTVFAPNNFAFVANRNFNMTKYLVEEPWAAHLEDLLLYHVVPDAVLSADQFTVNSTVMTLEGTDLVVTNVDPVQVNEMATVTTANVPADNGMIHMIDRPLLPMSATHSIVDIAVGLPEVFSTLVNLVVNASLVETLAADGPYTVLAPTNAAFAQLPSDILETLAADPQLLQQVLLYHVVPGIVLADQLGGRNLTTVEGWPVTTTFVVEGNNDLVMVASDDMANVETPNVLASNGVIHVIDNVLLPPWVEVLAPPAQTVVDVAAADSELSVLVRLLDLVGLTGALADENATYTVFAPTDAAFGQLPAETLVALQTDPEGLFNLLMYHVVVDNLLSTDLVDGQEIPTALSDVLTVSIDANGVLINDALVTEVDLLASNGVVHKIDTVLIPGDTEGPPDQEGQMAQTIADIAAQDPELSTLLTLLTEAGLADALGKEGPFTVLAPTNDAFNLLPAEILTNLQADPVALTDLLLYHIIPGMSAISVDLTEGEQIFTSLEEPVYASSLDPLEFNDVSVVQADIIAQNGVIHKLANLLTPTYAPPGDPLEDDFVVFDDDAQTNEKCFGIAPFEVCCPPDNFDGLWFFCQFL